MNVGLSVQGLEKVHNNLMLGQQELRNMLRREMLGVQTYFSDYVTRNKLTGGSPLKRRTGTLARSIRPGRVEFTDTTVRGSVGTNLQYARIHEYGGVIKAKNKKYLTIPLPAAMTSAGVLRKPAGDWEDTFVMRSGRGNLIIFQKRGARIVPLFVLKKQVSIPQRSYMRTSLQETNDRILRQWNEGLARIIHKYEGR